MNNHRQNADIDGPPWRLIDLVLTALVLAILLGLWAVGTYVDEFDSAQAAALATTEKTRLAVPASLAQAYERGLSEGCARGVGR